MTPTAPNPTSNTFFFESCIAEDFDVERPLIPFKVVPAVIFIDRVCSCVFNGGNSFVSVLAPYGFRETTRGELFNDNGEATVDAFLSWWLTIKPPCTRCLRDTTATANEQFGVRNRHDDGGREIR